MNGECANLLTLCLLITIFVVFEMFYYLIRSQLLEMKWVFKHLDLQMFGVKLNKYQ